MKIGSIDYDYYIAKDGTILNLKTGSKMRKGQRVVINSDTYELKDTLGIVEDELTTVLRRVSFNNGTEHGFFYLRELTAVPEIFGPFHKPLDIKKIIGYHHTEGENNMCLMEENAFPVKKDEDPTKHNWVGVIETNSGIKFNIEYPTPEMVDIHDIATALGMICRYNGQVPSFYSVAEHSVRVAEWLIQNGHPELALEGLMHDAAEAYIGDIVRPMKLMTDFAVIYNELEKGVELAIGEKFDLALWPMHPIVKEADKAVYEWEVEYIRTGIQQGMHHYTASGRFIALYEKFSSERAEAENDKREALKRSWDAVRSQINNQRQAGKTQAFESFTTINNLPTGDFREALRQESQAYVEESYDEWERNNPTIQGTPQTIEEYVKADIEMTEAIMKNGVGEVRITNPLTGGQKGSKLERFDLIPIDPLTELARHYGKGAAKYDANQWRKGYDWSLSYAALQRHLTAFWNGEDYDEETGSPHMVAVAWHAFALLEFMNTCPELDDRYGT